MALPQPCNSSKAIQQLLRWLASESKDAWDLTKSSASAESGHAKFIPAGRVKDHFCSDLNRVRDLIRAAGVNEYEVSAKHLANKWCKVFCILALINKLEFIGTFATYNTLWDGRLPFTEKEPPSNFPRDAGDPQFYEKFRAAQWQFCALELETLNGLHVDDQVIIPVVNREEVGGGGTAKVYRVEVHPEYDLLPPSNSSKHLYAIKTFRRRDAEDNATKEASAFQQVTDAGSRSTPGLIEFYGSFEHRGTFNIILEFADGKTLANFFEIREPPTSGEDIIAFWENLFETIKGVCAIHEQPSRGGDGPRRSNQNVLLQGWHQDIKPENILVISNTDTPGFAWSFKLADLGLCHFKKIMADGPEAMDWDAFGTQQYGAPECHAATDFSQFRGNTLVARSVDIWSLGCVFSEAFVWIAQGWEGIERFRAIRKAAIEKWPYWEGDALCFHDGNQLLPEAIDFLELMKNELKPDDLASGHILDVIYAMLSKNARARPSAESLEATTNILIRRAKDELRKRPPKTPPTPVRDNAAEYIPLTGSVSPRSPPARTRDIPSPSSPPPDWGLGRERVMYSTPQASSIDQLNITKIQNQGRSAAQRATTIPSASVTAQPWANRGPLIHPTNNPFDLYGQRLHTTAAVMPSATSVHISQNRQFHQSLRGPHPPLPTIPSWDSQQGTEMGFNSPLVESPPEQLTAAMGGLLIASETQKEVPYCSVDDAWEWRRKMKFTDKKAELPHHELRGLLENRDHVFMVDDSKSMAEHWVAVRDLVQLLAYIVKKLDSDGLDLYFLSSAAAVNCSSSSEMFNKITGHQTRAIMTSLDLCLNEDLGQYITEIRTPSKRKQSLRRFSSIRGSASASPHPTAKKRSIYVFTDGILEGGDSRQGYHAIEKIIEELKAAGLSRGQLGIQLISFGDDREGLARLRQLDQFKNGDDLDIVDTEPYTGNVWKMLLGSINPVFDRVDETVLEPSASFSS